MSGVPIIEVRGLTKAFSGRAVLDGVDLVIRSGEFTALLGPSGVGKTTLIRCIAGLIRPDRGDIRIDGKDVAALSRMERRRVAMVFQQFNLVPRLTALDNVLAGRLGHVSMWRGVTRRFERADRLLALGCLDRVGLLAQATQRADTLSGGQQQRVAIARALAQAPEVILADEPVASLDPATGTEVLDLLKNICDEAGLALFCSLHQVGLAGKYAQRTLSLKAGKLFEGAVAVGASTEI
jgi:phosphonate transport system ATP-binding protein